MKIMHVIKKIILILAINSNYSMIFFFNKIFINLKKRGNNDKKIYYSDIMSKFTNLGEGFIHTKEIELEGDKKFIILCDKKFNVIEVFPYKSIDDID